MRGSWLALGALALGCGGGSGDDGGETGGVGPTTDSTGVDAGSSGPGGGSSGSGDASSGSTGGNLPLPDALPFDLDRPPDGEPPTDEETAAFTKKLTGFWSDVDYFGWADWHAHGLHPSFDASMPSYQLWWQDTVAIKAGDTITFSHLGGADNIMIRTPKVLTQSLSGYLAAGQPVMRDLSAGYARGVVALFQGMVWGSEDPPVESITARAIFTHNHSYTTWGGRSVAVDYDPVKVEKFDWNAHTVPNPENPYFGDIWVRNMRSKDDVPHMERLVPMLMRAVQDAEDEEVREATQLALDHMVAFATDVIENDWSIRTKEDGMIWIPTEDLAHLEVYECTARLATALVATGGTQGVDCGGGVDVQFEKLAININYFNGAILHYFHLAAIVNALVVREDDVALELFGGLIERADWLMYDDEARAQFPEWDADLAAFLLAAGASGLPLTGREARFVQERYSAAVDFYTQWPYWDLYSDAVPDGTYDYKPSRTDGATRHPRAEEMTFLLHYCYSPWKNPNTVELVDCGSVLDPAAW